MKAWVPYALVPALLACAAAAQGKPAPLDPQPVSLTNDNATIDSGPSGASLESDYFHAPQPFYAAGRVFPCRLQLRMFEKKLLAHSCD